MSHLEATNVVVLERPSPQSEEQMDNHFLCKLAEQVRNHSRSSTKSIIAIGISSRMAADNYVEGSSASYREDDQAPHYVRLTPRCARNGHPSPHTAPARSNNDLQ
jgi:hypothetical protein